ncbi:hypothetical protein RFM68_24395 [Mesorhizobium sp. MSK_1335]|uniref:Uncharacterized protein n=1 Tax=Mesorhizobium montanum TaxID=3072323 RepID=A0ABU4ZQG2_9HYPH|nr:hypothetical protein [Mesorhizobium sp. MSK_1335]MDX8527646.1 hypothetical protein [Mesorhizobium sp. MSK_1335]
MLRRSQRWLLGAVVLVVAVAPDHHWCLTIPPDELAFQELPRVGESVSIPVEGSSKDLRVLRVVHIPGSEQGATTMLELTSKIL